jgi:hypothetical protein
VRTRKLIILIALVGAAFILVSFDFANGRRALGAMMNWMFDEFEEFLQVAAK